MGRRRLFFFVAAFRDEVDFFATVADLRAGFLAPD